MTTALFVLSLFVVAAVWAAAGVYLVLHLLGRLEANTADTELSLAMRRVNDEFTVLARAIANAMQPSMIAAAEAFTRLAQAFGHETPRERK